MTNSSPDAALASLRGGLWVLDDLGPSFREALLDRLHVRFPRPWLETLDLHHLTALSYGLAESIPEGFGRGSSGLVLELEKETDITFWNQVLSHVDRAARYRKPSDADRRLVQESLSWLARVAPLQHGLLRRWIVRVCALQGREFTSASSPYLFGCPTLDEAAFRVGPDEMGVSLIHEMAHHELFLLNLYDPLVTERGRTQVTYAPFQGAPRDALARLHAAHALFRMTQLQRQTGLDATKNAKLLRETVQTFHEDELTPFSKTLIREQLKIATS